MQISHFNVYLRLNCTISISYISCYKSLITTTAVSISGPVRVCLCWINRCVCVCVCVRGKWCFWVKVNIVKLFYVFTPFSQTSCDKIHKHSTEWLTSLLLSLSLSLSLALSLSIHSVSCSTFFTSFRSYSHATKKKLTINASSHSQHSWTSENTHMVRQ